LTASLYVPHGSYSIPGYGNLTPKSQGGKIATIFYALVGIPLMLLYMTNVGDALGASFKYLYSKYKQFCR
jgi:amino acid permease